MNLHDFLTRLDGVAELVDDWQIPNDWGRDDVDTAVAVWDRLDHLIATLSVLRREHGITVARRIPDEYTAPTRHGLVTVHTQTEKTETWDGHAVLGDLSEEVIDANGERIQAIPLDVARDVIPACGPGAVSSKWKVTRLRATRPEVEQRHHTVTWGDTLIARGVRYNARPRTEKPVHDEPHETA